ncbi:MAG: hypothetical protein R2911_03535 [Caldilineaceae bacterium]
MPLSLYGLLLALALLITPMITPASAFAQTEPAQMAAALAESSSFAANLTPPQTRGGIINRNRRRQKFHL